MLALCCMLLIDNWYRAQYTTHPDESDWSQNCTAIAALRLKKRPTYWAGHPATEDLAAWKTTVARALQQRERRIRQNLHDMGYADRYVPDTGKVRAPLDVRTDTSTVQAPVWRPLALSKEKVTCGVGLLNLLQFAKDKPQQTNRVLPLLVDENIHYQILKLLYGATMEHACLPVVRACRLQCVTRLQVCCYTHFSGVLSHSNLPTEKPATPWFNHTIISKADSYGKSYCLADACHTQDTPPVSSQGTGCNCNQWSGHGACQRGSSGKRSVVFVML